MNDMYSSIGKVENKTYTNCGKMALSTICVALLWFVVCKIDLNSKTRDLYLITDRVIKVFLTCINREDLARASEVSFLKSS